MKEAMTFSSEYPPVAGSIFWAVAVLPATSYPAMRARVPVPLLTTSFNTAVIRRHVSAERTLLLTSGENTATSLPLPSVIRSMR